MDSLHAILFYASSFLALGGGLLVALFENRGRRALALLVAGLGVAGLNAALSGGFAAMVMLVSFAGSAAMLGRPDYRTFEFVAPTLWRQVAGVSAAVLFVALAYAAYRGNFAHVVFNGGEFATAAVGRLLLAHDAIATEAVAALALTVLVTVSMLWRSRERER